MNERRANHPTPAQSSLSYHAGWAGRENIGIETLLASYQVKPESQNEREAIWSIVVAAKRRDPSNYDLQQLARASEGLTGAEIEAVFNEAMFVGFERLKEPADLDVAAVLSSFAPLSKLMAEQIAALKSWAINRARPATSIPEAKERKLRQLGV